MTTLGCVSTADLDGINTRLGELHVQTLELRKEVATRNQITEVENDLKQRIDGVTASNADLKADIDSLTRQVERLQAKLDETNFELSQLTQQIKATNLELQAVRAAAEQAQSSRPSPTAPRPTARLDETDPKTLYDTAYDDYLAGNYDLAILGFSRYLEHHGETDLADNAAYWLGECYYHQGQYQRAVRQFAAVLAFPGSDRTASAQIKKGYAHLELGQRDKGVADLTRVACDFAGTDEALLATQRLKEMGFDPEC